jgi:hypothetical protein
LERAGRRGESSASSVVASRASKRALSTASGRLSQARPIPRVRTLPCPPPRRAATAKSAQRAPEPRAHRPLDTPPPSRRRCAFGRCSIRCRSRKIEAGTPRPRDRRRKRSQPGVRQDGHEHLAVRDVSHDRPPPTAPARQNIHPIMRPGSWAHSIREPPGFTTPSPRLVRGRLRTAFSPSRPRSGNVPSPLATNGDASSGFFAIRFFFLARGNVAVAPALAQAARGVLAHRGHGKLCGIKLPAGSPTQSGRAGRRACRTSKPSGELSSGR